MTGYPGGWFGETWGAPVNEPERHMPVPVGMVCPGCHEKIKPEDHGLMIPLLAKEVVLQAHHLDCFMRQVIPKWPDIG